MVVGGTGRGPFRFGVVDMAITETLEIQRQLGSLQRPLYGPPVFKAAAKPAVWDADMTSPFSYSQGESVVGDKFGVLISAVRSAVVRLLCGRRPTAVFFGVRPVVVDSVDRRADRLISHVSVKINKRLAPRIADDNPAPAVIRVARVIGIGASLEHALPCPVLPRTKKSVRRVGAQAAASVPVWLFQIASVTSKKAAAEANAQPNCISACVNVNRRNGHRPAKYLAAEILRTIGKWYHLESHFGTPNIELARWARAFTPRLPSIIPATERGCLA